MLNALVHRSVDRAARADHAAFVATRLAVSFAALAVAPFFLAFRGAPTLADTFVLASALAPLAGACVVVRTGRLDRGRALAIAGIVALSLTLWITSGAGIGCAVAWLAAAQIEAMADRRLGVATALVAAAALFAMMVMPVHVARSEPVDAIFSALAFGYMTLAALSRPVARRALAEPATPVARDTWADAARLAGGSVLELDARGTVLALHGGPETSRPLDPAHVLARGFFEHVHVGDRPAFLTLVADAAHGAAGGHVRIRLRGSDADASAPRPPTHRCLELRALPGRVDGRIVALVRDIDAIVETIDEDATADRRAEIRHELRTPLNAIIGFSEMLGSRTLRPADVDKQIDYARIIHRSGQTLLAMIDSTLGAPAAPVAGPFATPAADTGAPFEVRMKKRA